ncbi:MAG: transglutaminase family protein [Pseudomonadota bacterium]
MRLAIRHETIYRYSTPLAYTIQQLHLTPRAELQQRVLSWQINTSGHRHAYTDAFGNLCHTLTVTGPHEQVAIVAQGMVETTSPERGRLHNEELQSPLIFTVATRLTEATPMVLAFSAGSLPAPGQPVQSEQLLRLAEHICGAVSYQSGATIVTTTATDALQLGRGVCQDHAHLFLACCHAHGIPARYVSGYIDPESTGHAESHAWIDAWISEADFTGWVSVDVTHARLMTDAYCRLAIGRDYDSAAPIRGVRRGGGDEILTVKVEVTPLPAE